MIVQHKIKFLLAVAAFCLLSIKNGYCQEIPKELYSASSIPDSLKEDANTVVRYSMEDYDVKGPGKFIYKTHNLITVLNEKGNYAADVALFYNKKFINILSFEMLVYDSSGKLLKKYHKSDLYDHALESDETLVSDDRGLFLRHSIASYPATIEVIYEREVNSAFDLGQFVMKYPEQSIQNEQCRVSISPDAGFRYLNENTTVAPQKTNSGNKDVYTWAVSNLKALKAEEGSKAWRVTPKVFFTQSKFDCYGYPGDISSWQNYGKWVYDLNKDVCTLSPQRVEEIKKMTDTIKTDKGKAKFLYEYMQKSMRYVAIQLGIGGYKPFEANFVDQKKYGDCKALANYMYALLKAVNIPSYWAVIRRGENEYPSDPGFPFNTFNHEILCIPFKNDTTWLECTGSHQPFGTLDESTHNRYALLITEDGGKLVSTPKSKATDNQFNSDVHIILQPDGGAKAHIKLSGTGEYRLLYIESEAAKTDEQKQFWLQELQIKQPSVFNFESGKDLAGEKQVDLDMEYDKFCDVMAADKQFYRPSVFKLWANTVPITDNRKTDFYWEWPRLKSCVTTIELPQGYEVESLPASTSLKFSFGNYDISYQYNKDKNQVVSTAKFVLNNQVIPAAKYTEMQQYMDAIAKAQNKKLVIHKKA